MPSLLTSSEKSSFGSIFNDLFDTFSREITVYKQPIKTITNLQNTPNFGYPEDTLPESVTYAAVYQAFSARIFYGNAEDDGVTPGIEIKIADTKVKIRVKSTAKDYIENGKTEKITFDNKSWEVQYGYVVKRFVDESYYEYALKETT